MLRSIRTYTILIAFVMLSLFIGSANRAQAQTYQIDCAILLCLSGGWPASVHCARARAEFIRRITPWPIEPPLQIWRCPMGASYGNRPPIDNESRTFDILFRNDGTLPRQSSPLNDNASNIEAAWSVSVAPDDFATAPLVSLIQDRADIDISGPEFNFVRSIRVFDVFIDDNRNEEDCELYASVRLGSYGTQGNFRWSQSNRSAIPAAFGPTRHGCSLRARAVFVEWRDYDGHYGFERVDY